MAFVSAGVPVWGARRVGKARWQATRWWLSNLLSWLPLRSSVPDWIIATVFYMVQRHRTLIVCSAYRTHSRASCYRLAVFSERNRTSTWATLAANQAAHRVQTGGDYFQDEAVWSTGLPIRPAPRLPTLKNSALLYSVSAPTSTTHYFFCWSIVRSRRTYCLELSVTVY